MIDYSLLQTALTYYSGQCNAYCGFIHAEMPWSVSLEAMQLTAPKWAKLYHHQDESYLVASGEQSFLQLVLDGDLLPGRYCCLTPCFRGDEEDATHKPYFMKLELFDNKNTSEENLDAFIRASLWWFRNGAKIRCEKVKVPPANWDTTSIPHTTYDIVSKKSGIELGSYGIREHPKVGRWIYGTGHAEPRASYVKELEKN